MTEAVFHAVLFFMVSAAVNDVVPSGLQQVEEQFKSAPSHELGLSSSAVEPVNHDAVQHETENQSTGPVTVEYPSSLAAEPHHQGAMEIEIENTSEHNTSGDALTGEFDSVADHGDDAGTLPSVEVALTGKPDETADKEAHSPDFKNENNGGAPSFEIALAAQTDETAENHHQSDLQAFRNDNGLVPTIEIALASDVEDTAEDQLDLPATKNEAASNQPTEENVVAEESEPADEPGFKISVDTTVGDPKVTTEVEEFEEVLDDGTVVKRKVTKTKEEQMVTQSFTMEGPDGAFDSADRVGN